MCWRVKNQFGLGFVGMGKLGRIRLDAATEFNRLVPVGFLDPKIDGGPDGLNRFETFDDLLGDTRVDAIVISTPAAFTNSYVQSALLSKKAVFAEKPPAISVSELQETRNIMASLENPVLMYGFNHRHKASFRTIMEVVKGKTIGNPLWIRGRYGKEMEEAFFSNWRSDFRQSGGGVLLDQGIHMVDLMLLISGGFDEVHGMISSHITGIPAIEDNAFAIMRSTSRNVTASLHSTMTQWRYLFALEVFFENGSVVWNGLKTPSGNYGLEDLSLKFRDGTDIPVIRESAIEEDEWKVEMGLFLKLLDKETAPAAPGIDDAISTMTLVEKIYETDKSFWLARQAELRARRQ